ncbi:MAG: tol-pal system-associated acyl-CoA thioesterase [Candidatus Omnitrophota bacterium]|nr:MAG: tol-pal system-associated acyl-CoA thioesterase [Candidatus Omnitrophota bacterium]
MKINKRIYYHDTDSGGVVYYANYLNYLEEGRTEYLREKGLDLKKLDEEGISFVVRDVSISYKAPAHYGDVLEIVTEIEKIKNASLVFLQEVRRADKLLVSAKVILVCINTSFAPVAIPEKVRVCIDKNQSIV